MWLQCPLCGEAPLPSHRWGCYGCGAVFDTFRAGGRCPMCGRVYMYVECGHCHVRSVIEAFYLRGLPEPDAASCEVFGPTTGPLLYQVSIHDSPDDLDSLTHEELLSIIDAADWDAIVKAMDREAICRAIEKLWKETDPPEAPDPTGFSDPE